VIDVGTPESLSGANLGVITALESFTDGTPVVCKTTGHKLTLPPATMMLLDVGRVWRKMDARLISRQVFMKLPVSEVKRAAGGCPVVVWLSASMSFCMLLHSPAAYGGDGDGNGIVAADIHQNERRQEIVDNMFNRPTGQVIRVPGLPDMYDYEYHPQVVRCLTAVSCASLMLTRTQNARDISMAVFLQSTHSTMMTADGMLAVSASAIESEAVKAGREWFAKTGREIWVVGPLEDTPTLALAGVPGAEVPWRAEEDVKVLDFLDDMKRKHGARSLIYVCGFRGSQS
jgi:hypothetical protein